MRRSMMRMRSQAARQTEAMHELDRTREHERREQREGDRNERGVPDIQQNSGGARDQNPHRGNLRPDGCTAAARFLRYSIFLCPTSNHCYRSSISV